MLLQNDMRMTTSRSTFRSDVEFQLGSCMTDMTFNRMYV